MAQIDWVQDAYTTTENYPYSQNADTSALPPTADCSGQTFNYVRNSVKVVINAYTGNMTFYVMDPDGPDHRDMGGALSRHCSPRDTGHAR